MIEPLAYSESVLLDIEGTTTPVDFVYRVLFPYAQENLADWLAGNPDDPAIGRVFEEYAQDCSSGKPAIHSQQSPAPYLNWLMSQDRKSPALKEIQGKIWESGYKIGSLKGAVFPDVKGALERLQAAGKRTFIYSSGSVLAQQLLFSHCTEGDLTAFLSGYFDTAIGPKLESSSYGKIAEEINCAPSEILFISDSLAELRAASACGMTVMHSCRPGNKDLPAEFPVVQNLLDLFQR